MLWRVRKLKLALLRVHVASSKLVVLIIYWLFIRTRSVPADGNVSQKKRQCLQCLQCLQCRMKHRGTKNRGRPKTDGDHGGGEYIWQNTQQLKTKKKGTKAWHCSEKGSCRSWRPLAPATTPGYARSWRSLGCRMQMAQLCAVGWCVEATIVQYF